MHPLTQPRISSRRRSRSRRLCPRPKPKSPRPFTAGLEVCQGRIAAEAAAGEIDEEKAAMTVLIGYNKRVNSRLAEFGRALGPGTICHFRDHDRVPLSQEEIRAVFNWSGVFAILGLHEGWNEPAVSKSYFQCMWRLRSYGGYGIYAPCSSLLLAQQHSLIIRGATCLILDECLSSSVVEKIETTWMRNRMHQIRFNPTPKEAAILIDKVALETARGWLV